MESEKAILKTVLYADIFDYPLTEDEIWRFLLTKKKESRKRTITILQKSQKFLSLTKGFFSVKGREAISHTRLEREKISEKKWQRAKQTAKLLSVIPSILLIGISGSLAMKNANKNDDIDMFILTRNNTLWLTRLFSLVLLELFRLRRKRNMLYAPDMVCINMFMDEDALSFASYRQTIYTAHEIVQMKPLFERNGAYERFLAANLWVKELMPNCLDDKSLRITSYELRKLHKTKVSTFFFLLYPFEQFARLFQVWYMKRHKSIEITTPMIAAFHPFDYQQSVLSAFQDRLKKYEI